MEYTITVTDADGDGIYVASDNVTTVWGAGPSPITAVQDYLASLDEDLNWLPQIEDLLGPELQRELAAIRLLTREVSA